MKVCCAKKPMRTSSVSRRRLSLRKKRSIGHWKEFIKCYIKLNVYIQICFIKKSDTGLPVRCIYIVKHSQNVKQCLFNPFWGERFDDEILSTRFNRIDDEPLLPHCRTHDDFHIRVAFADFPDCFRTA